MSDSAPYRVWKMCARCGIGYWMGEEHFCPPGEYQQQQTPWQQVTLSGPVMADAEIKDYLRRIAEALETLVNLLTPSKTPPSRINDEVFIMYANGSETILDGEP